MAKGQWPDSRRCGWQKYSCGNERNQTVVQTRKHITKYFTPKRKRQGQKKVKEGNKTPYVSRNNPDPDDPDDPPEVTESETDPDTKHSDQKMNMEESLSLSQKVSDDPPGEVTNESETDPVTKHSDQKTTMEESPDEDFVSVKVSVTDTIKKFLVIRQRSTQS